MTGTRPLLLLAVLLGGLLVLKGLGLVDETVKMVSGLVSEEALAAAPEEDEPSDDEEDDDDLPPPPDPREIAQRELPTANRLGLERNLAERRRDLNAREAELDTREQLLAVAEQRVDGRIVQLEALRDEVQQLLGQLDDQRAQQIAAIVNTYSQLEPEAAALIMTAMRDSDPDTLLLVAEQLQGQNPRKFAGVMAALRPDIAASLTTDLRQRAETFDERLEAEARRAAGEG